MEQSLFALDFETTGLNPRVDGVLEVGLVGARDYACIVSDAPPSAPAARAIHGISPQMARRLGKPGRVVLGELLEVLGRDPVRIVTHNVPFDRGFLEAWAQQEGRTLPQIDWLCTLTAARELCPDASISKSLGNLTARFGWHAGRLHRAQTDASLVRRLYSLLDAWRGIKEQLGEGSAVVYLAGPVRGDGDPRSIRYNQERMFALARWAQGVLPRATLVVPHGNFAFLDESGEQGLKIRERVLESCGQLLGRCDALILCGALSPGMAYEEGIAEQKGIPCFEVPGWDLPDWISFVVPAVA